MTTAQAIMDRANEQGCLNIVDAQRIVHAHGLPFAEALIDLGAHVVDARQLLTWLGY